MSTVTNRFSGLRNFILPKFKDRPIFKHGQSIQESYTFITGIVRTLVNFHRDTISAEVLVDEIEHGFTAVLVRFFIADVFVGDLADSSEELSQREAECAVVVEIVNDVSDVFE